MRQVPSTRKNGGDFMLFAPAMGIVSFQVLGGLSWFVSALCVIGIFKQWIAPTSALDSQQLLIIGTSFGVAGFVCFWVSRKIRAAVEKQ
jgi:hypothetical protein